MPVLFYLIVSLGLSSMLSAQEKPDFAFYQAYILESAERTAFDKQRKGFELTLTQAQKKNIMTDFSQIISNWYDYRRFANTLGIDMTAQDRAFWIKKYEEKGEADYWREEINKFTLTTEIDENDKVLIFDFNKDKNPDLVAIPETYFGPSLGYKFYARQNGKWQYTFDNSGEIVRITQQGKETIVHFLVTIIESTETDILINLRLNPTNQTWQLTKQYYASQTEFPTQKPLTQLKFSLKTATALRYSPQIDDKPIADTLAYQETTRTLRGNVVADFEAGAKGYILAQKNDWAMVAFLPTSSPIAVSLRHGMDDSYFDEKGEMHSGPRIKPYHCGWILMKDLVREQ